MTEKGRVVVIGSGAAGSAATRNLAPAGWDVTVVEERKVGGTCLWRGCMPKKALYTSAKMNRALRSAEQFGIVPGETSVDWQSVLAWKWHSQETYAGDQEAILAERGGTLVMGAAKFSGPDTVMVDSAEYEFDHAIIATGSVPVVPPIEGAHLADTSEDALSYHEVPSSLLIIGGGYIAFEFAGIFASLGTDVGMVISSTPLKASDPDATAVAVRHLERLGVRIISGYRLGGLAGEPGAVTATLTSAEEDPHEVSAEHVLLATGRRPALEGLALDTAGVETDKRGRVVLRDGLQTTNPRVWAAGDAAGALMQTPVANYMGHLVASSIEGGTPLTPDYSAVPTTVFTVPQIAQVGLTEAAATAQGIAYRVAITTFEYLGAAIIEDDRDGLVKLLFAEEDDRLIGAHIAGPTASDLIYGMALGIRTGATAADLQTTLGIHPGYAEALNWASG